MLNILVQQMVGDDRAWRVSLFEYDGVDLGEASRDHAFRSK